jgi:hypothetical protein
LFPTPAVLPNSSEKLGNNESAITVLTDNSKRREIDNPTPAIMIRFLSDIDLYEIIKRIMELS